MRNGPPEGGPSPSQRPGPDQGGQIPSSVSPGTADLLAAAVALGARHWAVLPCSPTTKAPLLAHGHLDASTDPDAIRRWWATWPDAMIGAVVPAPVIVLDIDPRNGGSLKALEASLGALPATLSAFSGRGDGGRHLYYSRPPGPLVSTSLPRGVDLKRSGFMIMPPSRHPATGLPYWWELRRMAALPARAVSALRPAPRVQRVAEASSADGRLPGLLRFLSGQGEGNRNKALHWAACRIVEDGLGDEALADLGEVAEMIGLDGLEVSRTLDSARRSAR
jgi:hypothetical protein